MVGVDVEQYDADNPGKYLTGMLSNTPDPVLEKAFRSFFSVVPTPPRGFKNFSVKVNEYMEKPPFKFPNPLVQLGGVKQVKIVRPPYAIRRILFVETRSTTEALGVSRRIFSLHLVFVLLLLCRRERFWPVFMRNSCPL